MARWGLVIVTIYVLVALVTPLLLAAGVLPDPNADLCPWIEYVRTYPDMLQICPNMSEDVRIWSKYI